MAAIIKRRIGPISAAWRSILQQATPTGTYTPTTTLTLNLSSATAYVTPYVRVGNVVRVSGVVTVDAVAVAQCQLDMSLPVASNFSAITQLAGGGGIIGGSSIYIVAEPTGDTARFYWDSPTTAARNLSYVYEYQVI